MTFEEAVNAAVQLMDSLKLNGNNSRVRGMAQAELLKSIPIMKEFQSDNKAAEIEAVNKSE